VSDLITRSTLPAISPAQLESVKHLESALMPLEQLPIQTEHIFHAGMYARTIRLGPGIVITGSLIKRATMLIINGPVDMLAGGWIHLDGYNVIPASQGRKQVFVSCGNCEITMIFPMAAQTMSLDPLQAVAEAEAEFTDEPEQLLSRRQDSRDTITITGE
jgi:hypothetical protein